MTDYCTTAELAQELGIDDNNDDSQLGAAIAAAKHRIDAFCGRKFDVPVVATDPAVVREVHVEGGTCLLLEQPGEGPGIEIASTTGLIVKADADGTYAFGTTLTINSDFRLHPRDAVANGRPWNEIRPTSPTSFPCRHDTYLQVTAHWGWLTVPDEVHKASLIQAAQLYKSKDAVFGAAALGESGAMYVRAALNPIAADLLRGLQIPVIG